NDFNSAEEICSILFDIAEAWKDKFTKMKAYLLQAQFLSFQNKESIPTLHKGLKIAKKLKLKEISDGLQIQIAFEKYKKKDFKGVFQVLKEVDEIESLDKETQKAVLEIKARSYWDIDDFIHGFDATIEWFRIIKNDENEIPTLFIIVVYLLTVMNSVSLPHSEEEKSKIKDEIVNFLSSIATTPYLFKEIILNLESLYARSLLIVEPEILSSFSETILQSVRWMDEEKYLYLTQKLAELYYDLNELEMTKKMMEKANQYIKERKYTKLDPLVFFKKTEYMSLLFFFMSFDPIFDPYSITEIELTENNQKKKYYLRVIQTPMNSFPSTSYSQLLRIIEKSSANATKKSKFKIIGLSPEEEKHYFILKLNIANHNLDILVRESFKVEQNVHSTLRSTVTPIYSVIGLLSNKKNNNVLKDVEELESFLLDIQRAINCPPSDVSLIFSENKLDLSLFEFYLHDQNFKKIKTLLLDCARQLKREYSFLKNQDFFQIFQSDPITIFDLSLRSKEHLKPLSKLLKQAYDLETNLDELKQFFTKLIQLFVSRGDTRFWKEFYYQYAWLHLKGEFYETDDNNFTRKRQLCSEIAKIAKKLKNKDKILECYYYEFLIELNSRNNKTGRLLEKIESIANEVENAKYQLLAQIFKLLIKKSDKFTDEDFTTLIKYVWNLSEFKDWGKCDELFEIIISKFDKTLALVEFCKKNELKETKIYPYLKLISYLKSKEEFNKALELTLKVNSLLQKKKDKFLFSNQIWSFFFISINLHLYDLSEVLPSKELEKNELSKEKILDNLIDYHNWMIEPVFFVKILLEKIEFLLSRNDFSKAGSYFSWVEQWLRYYWNLFIDGSSKKVLFKVQEIKKKIESQHFI
ncbi:MAG: hypothetical protein ACTSSF_05250, partial [Candidatus Heimdallarchaeaceae archaeon]